MASLDSQFEKIIAHLQKAETAIAAGMQTSKRPWLDYQELGAKGKFDVSNKGRPTYADLFLRTSSEGNYVKLIGSADGIEKEAQASKHQADFLAGLERDFRARQRSRIRTFAHGAALARAQGLDGGPLRRNTTQWIGRMLTEDQDVNKGADAS